VPVAWLPVPVPVCLDGVDLPPLPALLPALLAEVLPPVEAFFDEVEEPLPDVFLLLLDEPLEALRPLEPPDVFLPDEELPLEADVFLPPVEELLLELVLLPSLVLPAFLPAVEELVLLPLADLADDDDDFLLLAEDPLFAALDEPDADPFVELDEVLLLPLLRVEPVDDDAFLPDELLLLLPDELLLLPDELLERPPDDEPVLPVDTPPITALTAESVAPTTAPVAAPATISPTTSLAFS